MKLALRSYSCDVSAGYLRILADTFQHLLIKVTVSPPETQLLELDYVSDQQKRQIDDWSEAPNERSRECVHDLIHGQVKRNPEHEAVCAWDGSLTYQDLWTHVERLARVLSRMGAGPDAVVPLCFEKSKWTTVAILAILEAGAGFCLLDATQPISRLESLTRKLGARTLLCSRTHFQTLSSLVERVIAVDSETFKGLSGRPLDGVIRASSSNIVYVVFTSGSTGEPKAIVIEHGAFCSAAKAQASALCIRPGLRALQYASYVFDGSIQETLVPLMLGGTVCVPSEHSRINELAAAINQMRVEWAVLTPSVANFLTPVAVPQLQTLLLVGEVMSQENISTWSSIKLVNGYGPAECSVASVANSDVSVNKDPTQIGRGIGVRCWLVDPQDHNRLLPLGCAAELVIEGPTLARGYLNDPQRTRVSFIESPTWAANNGSDSAGRRMYKTGDIVRYNTSNGMLHFVGRKDTQVKLHGQRIELGEIEHHLANEPAISQSIVLMPKTGLCRHRLVAVISLKTFSRTRRGMDSSALQFLDKAEQEQTQSTVAMARESLSDRVPAFMIPPIWLVAQSIPLLKSGKLDRKAVYNHVQDMSEGTYSQWIQGEEKQESPATELEAQLRSIWADVLNLRAHQIGLKQSFLSLGGDSISAMMVQSRCKKHGIGTTVQDILRAKSLCHLATFAGTVGPSAKEIEVIEEAFDLSPIQSLYFEYPDRKGHFNQSVFVRLTKAVQPKSLHQAIKTIVNRHSMLRARFRLSAFDDEWKQRITNDVIGSYSFHVNECSLRQEGEPAMSKAQASLDPVNGPLFVMDLFNVEGSDQLLFMTAHHLVIDLVSWRVILEDLEELLTNPTLALEAQSSMSFQTWSKRQMEHAHKIPLHSVLPASNIPQQSFAYWGLNEGDNTYGNVACEGFELDTLATSCITSQCHQALHTDTVDVLIAAMMSSFTQTFTDRGRPTIFNEGHGREPWDNSIDLSRTVGWFTAMFPIHIPSSDPDDFVDILKRVKDFRRAVPANGRSYFASRQLTSKGRKKFGDHWPLEFTFNYLGIYQQLEREEALLVPVKELAGEARGAGGNSDVGHDTPRFGLFEISAVIAQGKLRFSFTFNRHMNHQKKIMAWISACQEALKTLPPKLAKMEYEPTPSDYPMISMTYNGLRQLITDRLPQIGIPDIRYVEDIYRCSQIQQGLLISRQKDAEFYAIHGTYKVCSKDGTRVDSDRIASAWQKVVSRHSSLRTIFVESLSQEDALYDQIVLKHIDPTIVRLYCETDADATQLLSSQTPMTHSQQKPSHRLTICETSTRQVFCKLELSHVIVDGASISIIFQELVAFYEERSLPETGPLYSDYIAFLQSLPPQAGIGYWKSYLADIEPTSFPVLNDASTRDRELHSKRIPIDKISTIQSFCNVHGVTMANVFHTAWALTLSCYTGSHDICFGYLMSARDDSIEGVEDLVGYLVNMLVCRVTFMSETPLITIMQQVQKDLSDGQAHRQTALSEVLHTLKLAGSSLFNTSLSYRKLPLGTGHQKNAIAFTECCPYYDPTEYNVSINIEVAEENAVVDLDYWTDCLSDGHATNVANTFLNALESIIEHSQSKIGQLRAVSESDRHQIAAWNSSMPETIEKCVHEVVRDQTNLRPQAQAIKAWDADFTYAELDALTGRLAAYLCLFGVTTETYVCLCFEKSAYTIVGMLGVLKAGGAFVPLDPMYPMPAIEMRIKDTRAQVVLASPCHTAMFTGMGVHVVSIDQVFLDKLQPLQITQSSSAEPHNPCCVIYTSGSTGRPKGVVLEHRALVTSCNAHGSLLRIGQDTRFLQFASYTYDNNLEEIFTTLQLGGTVCVPSDHDRMNDLSGAVSRLGANFMSLTPTVATYLKPGEMPTVKTLALGGEAITKAVLDIWGEKVTIHNEYGPSECSINSTLRLNIENSNDPSNIGHSVGSVSWVVDSSDHDRLVAIGCEGELLIEGPILARGYLNNAEKTSQAFIKDPAWAFDFGNNGNRDSRRMYKTGDLVRYNSDGSICYIGRKDQQVKLHGQRIELGEIEHHVRNHLEADWQYAVELITPGDGPGSSKALALFACPQEDDRVPATVPENGLLPLSTMLLSVFKSLEASLTKALPKYMVPALYIPLARLPLTASGKLDRKKLHSYAASMTETQVAMFRLAGGSGREPSTEIEKTLAGLWESVLRLGAGLIGMDAQFFRMGGDSVAAIRLVTAARSKGLSLTFADIFRNATLSEMCQNVLFSDALDSESAQDVPQPFALLPSTIPADRIISEVADLCRIAEPSVEDIYPCTSIQEGLIALSTKQPGAYVAQNIYRLSSINIPKFREAWETVVAAEGILRTRIVHTESLGFVQVVVSESIEWSYLNRLDEVTATGRMKPAYNGAGLTSYCIVDNGVNDAYFVWTIHHALYDGWSSDLVLDKVQNQYQQSPNAKSVERIPYSSFIRFVSSVDPTASDNFWQSKFDGTSAPQFPILPRPSYEPHVTKKYLHTVPLVRRPSVEVTVSSLIRAAWALTVSAYSNSDDVAFAETVTGRDAPVSKIVDMLGPTFATIPMRVQTRRDLTIAEYLYSIQEGFTEAMPYQHAGLQRIKRISSDTAKACEFQNLIAINTEAPDPSNHFWQAENVETDVFFTYALTVSFDVGPTGVYMTAHYDPDILPEWHLSRLVHYFESVLTRLNSTNGVSLLLGDIRTIHDEDRASIQQWNRKLPVSVDKCIHNLILEKSQSLPQSTEAICSWDAQFTYKELEGWAHSFAHHLHELGINYQSYVPVCFEKSALTIVVMLAVLKVGAAFVAIDGDSPKARLRSIVSDVEAKFILCSPEFEDVCDSLGAHAVVVDLNMIAGATRENKPLPTCATSDIAYIVFTSGSTGKPKGTLVPHGAFVSGALAHGPAMRMSSTSRVLQFASYTFDASIVEIFTTLILGGCISVPDNKARLNDPTKVINDMNVNWALLTPSFAQMISPKDVPGLETLVLGGEAMSQNHISTWADHTHLINAYGPSECAVVATVNSHVSSTSSPSSIGRAVGGRCFIADQYDPNELVPVGAVGELLVEGPILARGYLKQAVKTEQAFIRNPKWIQDFYPDRSSAERMVYRTGDLVKYVEDGSFLYLGRKDSQAKLHGQRLELGEVEHHLGQVTTVQHALAVIPSRGVFENKLIAVLSFKQILEPCMTHDALRLVCRKEADPHVRSMRDYVCSCLPPYMVPSNWIVLQDIPLLPSGKLDRRRMMTLVEDMPETVHQKLSETDSENAIVQGSEVEQRVLLVWSKILHLPVKQIGLDKNFLYLGGDSISALQVASQCRTEGLGVTVQEIMRSQSISHLAERVTLPRRAEYGDEEYDKPFELSPIQRLFFDWVGDDVNHFNQSIMLKLAHRQDVDKVAAAVKALVNSHSMLRAHFERRKDSEWVQRLDKEVSNSCRFTAHRGRFSCGRITSVVEQTQKSLDIQHGLLFAVDLFDFEEDDLQILSIVAHHLVIDVVSWGIILEDLEALLVQGKATAQPSLPFQIWSRLQNEHSLSKLPSQTQLYSEIPVADYAYWGMLENKNTYGVEQNIEFQLDAETTAKLLGPCRLPFQTELVDVLLGSILYSFRRSFPDRESIPTVFNEAHGREPWDSILDLTRTVGWFTTISPAFLPAEAFQDSDITKIIRWIKDLRSRNTGNGREYFSHRMLTEKGRATFVNHWPMEISFNYLGHEKQFKRSGALLQPLDKVSSGSDVGASVPRFALFEISASIVGDALKMSIKYSSGMQRQAGIKLWASELEGALHHSSERLLALEPQTTLSSVPLLPLSYSAIETLQTRLPSVGVPSLADLQDVHGCSPMQQGLLLSQIKNTGQYMYQSIFSVSFVDSASSIDTLRLSRAWEMVVERHSMLRTVFMESVSREGLMDQAVLKKISPRVVLLNSDTAIAAGLLREQKPLGFADLQPHHQLTICQETGGAVFCKLELSHALCDGTSIPIIIRDLAKAYTEQTSKAKEAMRYSQYISHIQQTSRDEDVAYWRRYLDNVEPCYFPALADGRKNERELRTLELELEDTPQLHYFCTQNSVTLSNVLQLVWSLVLRAYTGNENVCFGYLSSGRDVPLDGIQDAVGLFISMLVCRIGLNQDLQVDSALKQIQGDYTQSMAHQAFSLGDMQHELQLSGNLLFNTAFTFQRRSDGKNENAQQLKFNVVEAYDPSEYAVTVNVESHENDTVVHFNYWTDFVSDAQAENVSDTFGQVLRSIIRLEPSQQTIGALEFCSESHKCQVFDWNHKPLPLIDQCVHDVITHQSQSLPPKTPAVCSWDGELTYTELMSLANDLSRHLAALGVGPEVYVPICFEKTSWAVVAMLGVLLAGGAFVPLEPTHPDNRIKFIVEDVRARLILTSSKHREKFSNFAEVKALVVDGGLGSQAGPLVDPDISAPNPDNAAYLIFTSGTTGLPKGTIVSHRAFATGATKHAPEILMTKASRVLQFSNLCFDASIMEILTSLIIGACVCIPSDEERMNNISGAISRMSVSWTLLTPSVAKVLKPEEVPSLKVLVTGGEAMQAGHIVKWSSKASVVNAYGPSECAVIATTSIKADEQGHVLNEDPAVIGRAVGCRSWVVDPQDHGRLMPIGSVGELVLQGNTIARGYLNNEEKTLEAFVDSPSWMPSDVYGMTDGPAKIYKTGDLVRYNSDGTIVYISRKDSQIKLNGLRIELGEIEHHVKQNIPSDLQAAVEMVAPAGQQSLLAMFFASLDHNMHSRPVIADKDPLLLQISDAAISLCKALKASLAGVIPAYMIPSLFIPLSQMPWTASGKLDRSRLAKIVLSLSKEDTVPFKLASTSNKRDPTTEMEKKLRSLWETVLSLESASATLDDSFFVLGGDSVQAMRLVAAARAEKVSLSVLDIFRTPSLAEMAKACSTLEEEDQIVHKQFGLLAEVEILDQLLDEIVAQCRVEKEGLADAYPCSALQEGLITLSIKQPGAYVAHNVFRLPEAVDIGQFKAAWEKAVAEMDILRTRIVHSSMSKFVQVVMKHEKIEWYAAGRTEDATNAALQLPERSGSPLMRFTIVNNDDGGDRYFVWSIHHALYDGWSMPRMLQRVEDIYLEELSIPQRAPYSHFIRYLKSTDNQASERYWKLKFDGLQSLHFPKVLSLDADEDAQAKTLKYTIRLPEISKGTGFTLPTMVRAGWAILLSAQTGSEDVIFGETMTGRDVPVDGIIDMVGPTLTTVPTRIQVNSSLTIMEYLQKVNQMAADVIPHQHVGLQNIRRLNSNTATACDFQNLLVIQTAGTGGDSKMWHPVNSGVGSNFFTYPLVVECTADASSIHIDAHYNENVISKWHVERLVRQLESVLGQICSATSTNDATLSDVQVISDEDIETIRSWNSYHPSVVNKCIHDLFLQQAVLKPQSLAVHAWDGDFTYTELMNQARRLSSHLKQLGVAPENLVPFCTDKSRWALVAQLGVLMAGGGIVPL